MRNWKWMMVILFPCSVLKRSRTSCLAVVLHSMPPCLLVALQRLRDPSSSTVFDHSFLPSLVKKNVSWRGPLAMWRDCGCSSFLVPRREHEHEHIDSLSHLVSLCFGCTCIHVLYLFAYSRRLQSAKEQLPEKKAYIPNHIFANRAGEW